MWKILPLCLKRTSERDIPDAFSLVESRSCQFQSRIVLAVSLVGCYNILPPTNCYRSNGVRLIHTVYRIGVDIDTYNMFIYYLVNLINNFRIVTLKV